MDPRADKPEIVAPDGTNNTFFGGSDPESDGFPNFFGTSAAAPHAAAVAALMLELDPTLTFTPGLVYSALETTALDMGVPGFDNDTGFGLISAPAALAEVAFDLKVNGIDGPLGPLVTLTGTSDIKPSRDVTPTTVEVRNDGSEDGHLGITYLNVVTGGGILAEPECTSQAGIWNPTDFPADPCRNPDGVPPGGFGSTPFSSDVNNINDLFEINVEEYDPLILTEVDCGLAGGTWIDPPGVCQTGVLLSPVPLGPAFPPFGSPETGAEGFCYELGNLTSGETRDLLLTFHLRSMDNRFQGDTVNFDIEFTLHDPDDSSTHVSVPGEACGGGAQPWGGLYGHILGILGPTGTILPLVDPTHGGPESSTFTTAGAALSTFTWSEPPEDFDTPVDLNDPAAFQGLIPMVAMNGIDEKAETPDADYWSVGDGASDSAFSVGAWLRIAALSGTSFLLNKVREGVPSGRCS